MVQLSLFRAADFTSSSLSLTSIISDTLLAQRVHAHIAKDANYERAAFFSHSHIGSLVNLPIEDQKHVIHRKYKYQKWVLQDIEFAISPKRVDTFNGSLKCSCCNREGALWIVERHKNQLNSHLCANLYAVEDSGNLILMTVDHILPDSMGGKYGSDNFRTMCYRCNMRRSDVPSDEDVAYIKSNAALLVKSWMDPSLAIMLVDLRVMMSKVNAIDPAHCKEFNRIKRKLEVLQREQSGVVLDQLVVDCQRLRDEIDPPAIVTSRNTTNSWWVRLKEAASIAYFDYVPLVSWIR